MSFGALVGLMEGNYINPATVMQIVGQGATTTIYFVGGPTLQVDIPVDEVVNRVAAGL
jgi:uncharacterized protein YlzI (FlbEa/FlbD family)